ncbi:MAG: hypothetical protein HYY29_01140 [Chloroflexi bacterium]|nr:hypothetical protein [Chloroflexota bacterium]
MVTVLTWWAWLQVLAIIALPLAFVLFRNLPDRGYPLSKILGILFLSYLLWLGSSLHVLANRRLSIFLILLVLMVLSALVLRQQWRGIKAFFSANRGLVVATEVIFAVGILAWAIVRAYDPFAQLPEHAMNLAFINTILRSDYMPPQDPWLSGYALNYYYFGQFVLATLTRLSGIPVYLSYNLAIGLIFSMAALGVFSLTFNLTRGDRENPAAVGKAIIAGCAAVVFLLLLGNLEGVLEFMYAHNVGSTEFWQWVGIKGMASPYSSAQWYPTEPNWWVRSARVLDTLTPQGGSLDLTLNDNVFLNLMVGYPHAHLMAVPLALLAISFSLALFRGERPSGLAWLKRNWFFFTAALVSVGALGPTNSWDLATYGMFFIAGVAFLGYMGRQGAGQWWFDAVIVAGVAIIGALLLYIPYYNSYQAYGSIRPWAGPSSRIFHQFLLLGFTASICTAYLLARATGSLRRASWRSLVLAVLLLAAPLLLWIVLGKRIEGPFTPSVAAKLLNLLPLLVILFVAALFLLINLNKINPNPSAVFHGLCLFTAFYIVFGVELFYFQDALLAGRGNTVFKFYYHAWVLLAVAAGYAFYHLLYVCKPVSAWRRTVRASWWVVFLLLLSGSLLYPVAGILTKTNFFKGKPTLDALSFLPPADREVIDWLSSNIRGTPVIVEASNVWSLEESRISSRTGLPTIMGWVVHEKGWRGADDREYMARIKDLELIYRDEDLFKVQTLLTKYQARFIVVGWIENQRYGAGIKERFDGWFEKAFSNSGTTIYRTSPTVWRPARNPKGSIMEVFYRHPATGEFGALPNDGQLPQDSYHLNAKVKNTGPETVTVYLEVVQSDGIRLSPWGAPEWELGPGQEVALFVQGLNLRPAPKTVQLTINLKEKGSNTVLDTKVLSIISK